MLEVGQCPRCLLTEDPVGSPAVEAQLVEGRLQRGDVITTQVGGGEMKESVAQDPTRFDECQPGLLVAVPGDPETTCRLELGDGILRGRAIGACIGTAGGVPGGAEAAL